MSKEEYVLKGPKPIRPLSEDTVGQQLYEALMRYQHLPEALIDAASGEILSYRTILEESCKLAESLKKCGYSQNSVISICSENNLSFFLPVIAALYLGITVAPLNENYGKSEFHNSLNISKPQIIFCSRKSLSKVLPLQQHFAFIQKVIVIDSKEDVDHIQSLQNFVLSNLNGNFDHRNFKPLRFDPKEQVALIMNSSGTTGLPKGVMLTHKNISIRLLHCLDPICCTQTVPETSILSFMPFFHGFGLLTTLGYLSLGLRTVIMRRFEPELFLKTLEKYRIRSMLVVPPVLIFLTKSPLVDKYDLSNLEEVGSGAAPLGKEISMSAMKRLNIKEIRQGYGLTETTLAVTFMPANQYRIGSSGKLVPLVEAKVVDIETGKNLGPNQSGELCFRGEFMMKGYAGNPKATNETIHEDGWLHTGDVGYYDEDEYVYVIDRIKELIKYKGYQVPPAELEALLLQHDNIKDAAVVGIPAERVGELPAAFIVKKVGTQLTAQEVYDYIADQVSSPKHLRGGVYFIDEIPKNATGKIMRRELSKLLKTQTSKL